MELYDADRVRGCLEGKHIVLLGDSTMSETVHDLVLLVSGLANWPDQVNTYIYNATRSAPSLAIEAVHRSFLAIRCWCHINTACVDVRSHLSPKELGLLQARQGLLRDLGPL